MNTLITKHLYIAGRVQGVYYRQSMQEKAEALCITGWCRNLPDGRVEAVIQGREEPVEAMMKWAYSGPAQAIVDSIEVLDADPAGRFNRFEVRR